MADPRMVQAMMARAGVSPVLSDPRQFPTPTPDQEALEDPLIAPETYGAGSALRKGGALAGMTVFHGTPHRFPPTDRNPLGEFDAAKIGTGEGAQAYGHGLYFAENPKVAKDYKEVLQTTDPHLDGKKLLPSDSNFWAAQVIARNGYNRALSDARRASTAEYLEKEGRAQAVALAKQIKMLKKSKITSEPTGSLYTVDLPDEHIAKMLDWDEPLSRQSEVVQALLQQAHQIRAKQTGGAFDKLDMNQLGKDAIATLGEQRLQQSGIPGIKYLDHDSRLLGTGKGTRNFVVFDETLPKIIGRE